MNETSHLPSVPLTASYFIHFANSNINLPQKFFLRHKKNSVQPSIRVIHDLVNLAYEINQLKSFRDEYVTYTEILKSHLICVKDP